MKKTYQKPFARNLGEVFLFSEGQQECSTGSAATGFCRNGDYASLGCRNGNSNVLGEGCRDGNLNAGVGGAHCENGGLNQTGLCFSGSIAN